MRLLVRYAVFYGQLGHLKCGTVIRFEFLWNEQGGGRCGSGPCDSGRIEGQLGLGMMDRNVVLVVKTGRRGRCGEGRRLLLGVRM